MAPYVLCVFEQESKYSTGQQYFFTLILLSNYLSLSLSFSNCRTEEVYCKCLFCTM